MALATIPQIIEKGNYTMSMTTEHPSVAELEQEKQWSLGAQDRCDACSAEALVKVSGVSGELLFCGHHYNKIMDNAVGYHNMMKFMVSIVDEREKLVGQ